MIDMPFQPGTSGNDKGRPKNTGHRQQLFNSLVVPYKEGLIKRAIEMALDSNEAMLKLFLDRMLPAKPVDDPISIALINRDFTKANILLELGSAVLKAISSNEITPEQGKAFLDVISAQRKNIEASTLTERISEIEFLLNLRKEKNHA